MFTLAAYEDTLKVSELMGKVIGLCVIAIVVVVIVKLVRGKKAR